MSERSATHEPRCNTNCRPGVHFLTSGIGYPHIHATNMASECGACTADAAAPETATAGTEER